MMQQSNLNAFQAIQELTQNQTPCILITLVDSRGSVPQDIGARAVITQDGLHEGTIGGGKVEAKAIEYAKNMLLSKTSQNQLITWNLTQDVGMTCGGEVKFFFEAFNTNQWNIFIFGAGHVAQSLVRALIPLQCSVTCIDPRESWLAQLPESSNLKKIHCTQYTDFVSSLSEDAYVVSITQGHAHDLPLLKEILRTKKLPYLGVIGSKAKALVLRRELQNSDFTADQAHSFFCPIGLPIGSNNPNEIAISIVAQLLEVRDSKV